MLKSLLAAGGAAILLTAPIPQATAAPKTLVCNGSYTGGTYFSVTVPAGASCTMTDAKVTHGLHAKDAANVILVDTDVARNVNVRGTTGLTAIKTAGCKQDPLVGNNVMVRRSHDVLICEVHARDNIMVTGNNGLITVRDSAARQNIFVSRNLPFVADNPPSTHKHPDYIRVFRDTAGHHIFEFNDQRHIVNRGDSPTPVIH